MKLARSAASGIQEYARVRARESKVSREMVANCSRPVCLLQLMLSNVTREAKMVLSPDDPMAKAKRKGGSR
jgi:hypothetical protein